MADEIGRLLKEDPARGVDAAMHAYMGLCFMIVRTGWPGSAQKKIWKTVSVRRLWIYMKRGTGLIWRRER